MAHTLCYHEVELQHSKCEAWVLRVLLRLLALHEYDTTRLSLSSALSLAVMVS
jgi:hypothetical protein